MELKENVELDNKRKICEVVYLLMKTFHFSTPIPVKAHLGLFGTRMKSPVESALHQQLCQLLCNLEKTFFSATFCDELVVHTGTLSKKDYHFSEQFANRIKP